MLSFFGFGKSKKQAKKKFSEPLNTAVFTTKFIINENKVITYVSHEEEDGSWQFFSDDEFESFGAVAALVLLKQIINRDKTILEIADLPLGYIATRKSLKDKWKIEKAE